METGTTGVAPVITPQQLFEHWQGHRRLTRKTIEAFPDDQLFTYSIGGMRTFGELGLEFLAMTAPMIEELTADAPREYELPRAATKEELLRLWDQATEQLTELWARLPENGFQETRTVFGQYTSQVWDLIWYVIDNEIHHRGQGYVYLRALGVEPPPFYERD